MNKFILIALLGLSLISCAQTAKKDVPKQEFSYQFSSDWTSMHTDNWKKHLSFLKEKDGLHFLEIGIYEGRSAFWFLDNILIGKNNKYTGIDHIRRDNLTHNMKHSDHKKRINVIYGKSSDVLKTLPKQKYDLVYIDGDHRAYNVLEDAMLVWPLVKNGGHIIFDDYEMFKDRVLPDYELPRHAIDFFLYNKRDEIEVVHRAYQVIVKKYGEKQNADVVRIGKNLFYHRNIYEKDESKVYLLQKVENKRFPFEKVPATKKDLDLINEMLTKIPVGRLYFPKELTKNKKYSYLFKKFDLLSE